jgi:hypothetical protein
MKPVTEAQDELRATLLTQLISGLRDSHDIAASPGADRGSWQLRTGDPGKIRAAALALTLPEPADHADASAQIDALRAGGAGLISYAQDHSGWARPVFSALVTAWSADGSRRPETITVAALRALAAGGAGQASPLDRDTAAAMLADLGEQVGVGKSGGAERAALMRRLAAEDWTQDEIARAAGISQAAVSKALRSAPPSHSSPSVLYLRGRVLGIALHLSGHHSDASCGNLALKLAYGGAPVTPVTLAQLTRLLRRDLTAPGVPAAYGDALAEVQAQLRENDAAAPPAATTAEQWELMLGQHQQSSALTRTLQAGSSNVQAPEERIGPPRSLGVPEAGTM